MGSIPLRLESLDARTVVIPLRDPFVIATHRVEAALSSVVTAVLSRGAARATGIGEAAALPGADTRDQNQDAKAISGAFTELAGLAVASTRELSRELAARFSGEVVVSSGIEMALIDAEARLQNVAARTLLSGQPAGPYSLETDVTLPIDGALALAQRARGWAALGFRVFKMKVGIDLDRDLATLEAVAQAVPGARFRIDANGGYSAAVALELMRGAERLGLTVECFEQPCAREDLDGMAEVTRAISVPVIADESVSSLADLQRVAKHRAATGINLKIVKTGGMYATYELGLQARRLGLKLMMGGMIESRLGIAAATHLTAAMGGVDFADLDSAWLLAEDPFTGGYVAEGPRCTLLDGPGFGVTAAAK